MSESEPIRIGLVGAGRAGWGMHCKELESRQALFCIVAACDDLVERRERMSQRYGCATYADYHALIADPNVELVDIASRSCDHVAHAVAALAADKDVFLEKPMSLTYAGAEEIRQAAEHSRGKLYMRHNRRFEPAFNHIREILASGILGEVFEIKLRRVSYQRRDDWQTLKVYGGGQLLNWGPHIVDHALQFLGAPVQRLWGDLKRVAAVGDAEDHLKIILVGTNGRLVDLEISGGAALGEPEYLIWGSQGALRCDEETITLKYLDPEKTLDQRQANPGTPGTLFGSAEELPWIEKTIPVAPSVPVEMSSIWDALYETIRHGKPFPITLDEAVEVMRVIDAVKAGTPFQV